MAQRLWQPLLDQRSQGSSTPMHRLHSPYLTLTSSVEKTKVSNTGVALWKALFKLFDQQNNGSGEATEDEGRSSQICEAEV